MYPWLHSIGEWLEQTSLSKYMEDSPHLFPAVIAAHFFSLFLLVGTSVVLDLRVLGLAMRRQPVTQLAQQLFPWTWAGLGLAVASGFFMFTPSAGELVVVAYFWIKLGIILAAGVLAFLMQRNARHWDQSPSIPTVAKLLAAISMALWIGALLAAVQVAQYANV